MMGDALSQRRGFSSALAVGFLAALLSSHLACQRSAPEDQPAVKPPDPARARPPARGPLGLGVPAFNPRAAAAGADALPIYRFDPVDMTTSVGKRPLRVWLANRQRPVGAARLDQLASAVSLRLWPELTVVPTRTRVEDVKPFDDEGRGHRPYASVFVEPIDALADRWYALYIERPPGGLALANDTGNAVSDASGAQLARFRPGSEVVLVGVREHVPGADQRFLTFDYSETFDASSAAVPVPVLVPPAGQSGACTPLPTSPGVRVGARGFACRQLGLVAGARITTQGRKSRDGSEARFIRELDRSLGGADIVDAVDGSRYVKLAN
jgi:hypothetical protein